LNYKKRVSSPYTFIASLGLIVESKLEELPDYQLLSKDNLHKDFAANPIEVLKSMGAQVSLNRRISVLDKIRNLFPEFYAREHQFTAIGYPVFIADNSTGKNLKIEDILGFRL
jgi:hypothetical protein